MKRVFIPFDLPVFEFINSNHPLPASLLQRSYEGIEFVRGGQAGPVAAKAARPVYEHAAALVQKFRATSPKMVGFDSRVLEFIHSRDMWSQAHIDTGTDIAFFHTAPMHVDQMPWILHIENVTTLFHPSLAQGDCQDIALREIPAYWFVRAMLESERCRGVFTNLSITKDQVERIFDSPAIARKTHHVPAGPHFTAQEERTIAAAVERKRTKDEIEILFTNSWHQRWPTFFLRGGPETVMAFLAIEKQIPNVRLTLRTVWPDMLRGTEIERAVRGHPKISLLEQRMSDAEMIELFARADIFALDAASVHSISLLRAMACGAVCLVSDVPGYEDYVKDGESAVVLPGRRASIYSVDPESGWLRDDARAMFELDNNRVRLIAEVLLFLCGNRDHRLHIGANARRRVLEENNFAAWSSGFEAVLRSALGGER